MTRRMRPIVAALCLLTLAGTARAQQVTIIVQGIDTRRAIPVSGSGVVTVFAAGSIKLGCELQNTRTVPRDQIVAAAMLDRLLHHGHVLIIRGDSYRMREKQHSGLIKATQAPVSAGASQ